jgi:hypothetical protein
MNAINNNARLPLLPLVALIGAVDHPDFRDAIALLRATARCELAINTNAAPEVVILGQTRPGQVGQPQIEGLQKRWPLAAIVTIVGSWCEGELRTGRPVQGDTRLYWYEFPAWWQRQIALWHAGRCPEWARPTVDAYRSLSVQNAAHPPDAGIRNRPRRLIQLRTPNRDTADTLADLLHVAGYATVWNPLGRPPTIVRGAAAGIWDGAQLDDCEVCDLADFCRSLARDAAPVVALLDFPRRDRVEVATQIGAAAVLGKPWINTDLVATIENCVDRAFNSPRASSRAA